MKVSLLVSRFSLTLVAASSLGAQSIPAALLAPPDSLTDLSHYYAAIHFACPGAAMARGELFTAESRVAGRTQSDPTDAGAWHELACARARLDLDGSTGREGILMPLGTSWQEGAINAELKALALTPNRRESAELLAVLMSDQPEPKPAQAIRIALARAVISGVAAPAAVRGCASLSLRLGDLAATNRCVEIGLEGGADSTWQLLMLARLASRTIDTAFVMTLFDGALGSAHDAAAWSEVGWHLRWFLEPDEWSEWQMLDDASRGGWVLDRLASRDIRDGKRAGARLVEHFHRLDYAEEHFRLSVPRNQRGRFAVAATPENRIGSDWVAKFRDPALAPAAPWRFYARFDYHHDDRAAVWMRWGKPEKAIPWSGSILIDPGGDPCRGGSSDKPEGLEYAIDTCLPAGLHVNTREVWVYHIDEATLLLNFEAEEFDASQSATRLVGGVLGLYMCAVDNSRCVMANRSSAHGLPAISQSQIATLRQADRENIREATTHDDNSVRVEHHIATVATLSRVWDPASGATLAVLPYALRIGDLAIDPDSSTATIDLAVRQWNPVTASWQTTEVTRRLRLPASRDKDAFVTGYFVVPSTPGVSAWSLVAGQGADRLGRTFADRVPPLATGPLTISDVVLGAESQGQDWQTTGGRTVPLGPLGAYDRKQPVAVYWQVQSARARGRVRTTIRLLRTDRKGVGKVALEVATEGELAKGLTEVQREVGVAQLDPGAYRLEVELTDLGDHVTVKRSAPLLLR